MAAGPRSSHRQQGASDETTVSETTAEARALALAIWQDRFPEESADSLLRRTLSTRTSLSADSDLVKRNNTLREVVPTAGRLKVIGRGTTGTVFEATGTEWAFKKGSNTDALWNDYHLTNRMADAMGKARGILGGQEFLQDVAFPRIPICQQFLVATDEHGSNWWKRMQPMFTNEEKHDNRPETIYAIQRILPLPKATREALICLYFEPTMVKRGLEDPKNEACLARVYLGERRNEDEEMRDPYMSLWNFELRLDQLIELGVEVENLAKQMAVALATAHWIAQNDCTDAEFVLGTATQMNEPPYWLPNHSRITPRSLPEIDFGRRVVNMWMFDFDKARTFEFTKEDVDKKLLSVIGNDPYYPSPVAELEEDKELWRVFSKTYLEASEVIMEHKDADKKMRKLPRRFIDKWVEQARKNKEAEQNGGWIFFEE